MTASDRQAPRAQYAGNPRRRRIIQWSPFVLVGLLSLAVLWLDGRLKTGSVSGPVPSSATWRLEAPDLPRFWTRWETLSAYGILQDKAPPFMHEVSVAVRKATGVRPTPARLRTWLGPRIAVAGNDSSWSLSCRPGVAMRLASVMHGIIAQASDSGIRNWGGLAYAWQDGVLLVADSTVYLSSLLASGKSYPETDVAPDGIKLHWAEGPVGTVELWARDGLPFQMKISTDESFQVGALRHIGNWPEATLLINSVNEASNAALGRIMDRQITAYVPAAQKEAWHSLATSWWEAQIPPVALEDCGGETVWMAFEPGEASTDVVPRIGGKQYACASGLVRSIGALDAARPYRWDNREGWLVSSPQHVATWSIAQDGEAAAWASEPSMVPLLLDVTPGKSVSGIFYGHLQWSSASQLGGQVLTYLAEEELIPGYSLEDVQQSWIPYVDALGSLGYAQALGEKGDDGLQIRGYLAATDMG